MTALLLLLLSTIAWIEWPDSSDIQIDTGSIRTIQIHVKNKTTIVLQREQSGWIISQPMSVKANSERIKPLLSLLNIKQEDYALDEIDLVAAGLDNPQVTVQLDQYHIALGKLDVGGQRRYAFRDDRILFVPEWVLPLISGGASSLANAEIFPELLDKLTITINKGGEQTADTQAWQSLRAQQVLVWPIKNMPTSILTGSLRFQASGQAGQFDFATNSDYTLFYNADRHLAYVVSNADMHKLLPELR